MEIEIEFVDKQHVNVIGIHKKERKKIGNIFTPSGSGESSKNAIQVCGFNEAFDLWGCANYQTYKISNNGYSYEYVKPKTFSIPHGVFKAFDIKTINKFMELI